jgi:hypothetical protein
MSLTLAIAAAAGLGAPKVVWIAVAIVAAGTLVVAIELHLSEPRKGHAKRKMRGFISVPVIALGVVGAIAWQAGAFQHSTARVHPAATTRPLLKLKIDRGVAVSGLGPADMTRLQLWATALNLGAPTILYGWDLKVRIGERPEVAEYLPGAGQRPLRSSPLGALDVMTGTKPIMGIETGLLYFVLPNARKPWFNVHKRQFVLSLSVRDQEGVEWRSPELPMSSFRPDETETFPPPHA